MSYKSGVCKTKTGFYPVFVLSNFEDNRAVEVKRIVELKA